MKIYAVVLKSWWNCPDIGRDESDVLYTFITKDLAVEYIVREIEELRTSLINQYSKYLSESQVNKDYWESELERVRDFKYDIDEIKEEGYADITELAGHELWGDNNEYQIEEHEVLEELPKDD